MKFIVTVDRSGKSVQVLDILCFVGVAGNSTGNCRSLSTVLFLLFPVGSWLHFSVALFSDFISLVLTGRCLRLSCGFKEVTLTVLLTRLLLLHFRVKSLQ